MDLCKKIATAIVLIGLCLSGNAKIKPLAHYNFGKAGNITYAAAPQVISPIKEGYKLNATGSPLFFADAPGKKALKGDGSILFNGKGDGYRIDKSYGAPLDNMVLEIWVKARTMQYENDKPGNLRVVVANGNGKTGHVIAQRGHEWILLSGGAGIATFGDVVKDRWVHLAIVTNERSTSLWYDGKKMGEFPLTKSFAPNFSIACDDNGENSFYGDIYEVRYSTFDNGKFDANSDFLLDYEQYKKQADQRTEERKAFVKTVEAHGFGKEIVSKLPIQKQTSDWLLKNITEPCKLIVQKSTDQITSNFMITNGLVSRTFYVSENIACVGYKNLSNDAEFIRAIKPEARLFIDSVWYDIGGLTEQPEKSYLLESWYPQLENKLQSFVISGIETGKPIERYPWKPKFNSLDTEWPTKGLRIIMTYKASEFYPEVNDIEVKINYEIYEGLPIMTKWLEVYVKGDRKFVINEMECEVLAINQDQVERIHVESDYSFALVNVNLRGSALMHFHKTPEPHMAGESTTKWEVDKEYNTWATQNPGEDNFMKFPHRNLLISKIPMGPNTAVSKDEPFKSFITFELLQDSDDRERKSLGQRRLYKKLAPQTTESLIAGAITSHDRVKLKAFIDQMGELGMERLDIHPWPGISHDKLDEDYVALWKEIADYARQYNIIMGGYELQVASRGRGHDVDCIDPDTGKPGCMFGQSVCIASTWKDTYYTKMWEFFDKTGLMTFNMDGPYHGDACASTEHPYHTGFKDSQWQQWKTQVEVIHELQRRNMYVPIPDWYFLNGQSSTGMGYREATANLTPSQQMLLGRQYIYDGTWHKLPPMGWMTLQLVGFYTNDPRVGLEPLADNLDRYEQQLIQFLASGCQLSIRGNRMYDTPATKAMVSKWINWFKTHREILTSEIIHVSRPNGRDLDCMLHVNPFIKEKGMVIIFNPTDREIEKEMKLSLYYTGLKDKASVKSENGEKKTFNLNAQCELLLPVKIKAGGTAWYVIEE